MIDAKDIAAVLLAAGRSRRFGADDKLLAPIDGEPLVVHAARPLLELAPAALLAVCRDRTSACARLLAELGFEIVANPNADDGLSTSLARGLARAAASPAHAALVCLGDMPRVPARHLRALLAAFDSATAPLVASRNGQAVSPPALFARARFAELQTGSGDHGARRLLLGAATVAASADELRDVDRPEELP